jgi:hypothetical protein
MTERDKLAGAISLGDQCWAMMRIHLSEIDRIAEDGPGRVLGERDQFLIQQVFLVVSGKIHLDAYESLLAERETTG